MIRPIVEGAVVWLLTLVAPFAGGAFVLRRRHHEEFIVLPPANAEDTIELYSAPTGERLDGYVASESELFFRDDPLGAHSLPDVLEHHELADTVVVDLVNAGVLPSNLDTYVDTAWKSWGYELESEVSDEFAFELETDLVSLALTPTSVG